MLTTSSPAKRTLGNIYPSAMPTITLTISPPVGSSLKLRDIILIPVGGVVVVVISILILGCIICYKCSKHSHITAEQKALYKRADKLDKDAKTLRKNLPRDPGEREVTNGIISRKMDEAKELRAQAASLRQERYNDYLDKADKKESEEIDMIQNLSSDPEKAKLEKQVLKDKRKAKKCFRKKACRCMPDSDAKEDENKGDGNGENDTSATG